MCARRIDKYCVTCHNQRLKTGDLALDAPELTNVAGARRRVGKGDSQGARGHDAAGRICRGRMSPRARALVTSLESTLDAAARTQSESRAGRSPIV